MFGDAQEQAKAWASGLADFQGRVLGGCSRHKPANFCTLFNRRPAMRQMYLVFLYVSSNLALSGQRVREATVAD